MNRVGFIGLGNMGGRVCRAIAAKGYPVTAYDLNQETLKGFVPACALAQSDVDVLEKSDIVFLSLPSSKQVEPMVARFIASGVQGKTIVDTSTSYPMSTKRLFAEVKAAGGDFCDIPISGLPSQAEEGKLLALYGGEKEVYDRLAPVVGCYADRFAFLGEAGAGHVTKLIFNFIALSYVNIYAMAFPLTEKMGLDNHQLFELLMTSGMGCGTMNFYVPKMIDKTYDMAFALELAHKDLTYVKGMFEEYQVPAYALDGTLDLLRTGIRDGKGKLDYSACISTMFEFFDKK